MKRIIGCCILVASVLQSTSVLPIHATPLAFTSEQTRQQEPEFPDVPAGEILGAKYTPVYIGPVTEPLNMTHTVDTHFLENNIEGHGYDCWYRFSIDRKMLLIADHAGSEVLQTSLFLYNYNPEFCLERQMGHQSIEPTRPLWEPYEALVGDEIRTVLESGYGRAFMCCIVPPGEYHVISEGTSLNGVNNGVITTHIHLLDIPGSTYTDPHEFGTHDRDFILSKTFDASNYGATFAADRTARIIGHIVLSTETDLSIRQRVDIAPHYGFIPDAETQLCLQDTSHLTIRTGAASDPADPNDRTLAATLSPGEYFVLATLRDTTAQVTLELTGIRKREPGYSPDQPIDLGVLRPDTTARAVNDTHDFAGNHTDTCNRVYYAFSLPVVADVTLSTAGSPVGATRILLSDAAGIALNDSSDVASSSDSRGAQMLTCLNLPAGTYVFSVEGTSGNGLVCTSLSVSEAADIVPEPAEFTPSLHKNYILTVLPNISVNKEMEPLRMRLRDARFSIAYYDGLGRPEQTVLRGTSPSKRDLVSSIEYDMQGMESRQWLVADHLSTGKFIPLKTAQGAVVARYRDASPCSETTYEPSPLRRTVRQYGPGAAWRAADRSVTTEYLLNTSSSPLDCRLFRVSDDSLIDAGCYASQTLTIRKQTDEDGHAVYIFTDRFGRMVLERRFDDDGPSDTYYVYDVRGDLRFVLPPALSACSDVASGLEAYAFCYRYDAWHRPVASKTPGAAWVFSHYDASGQKLFTQTGEQRLRNEWTFSVCDLFGRPAVSGLFTGTLPVEVFSGCRIHALRDPAQPSGYTLQGTARFTLEDIDCLILNFYDDYAHLAPDDETLAYLPDSLYGTLYPDAKGLLTGSVVRSTDGSRTRRTAVYYDRYKRPIQTRTSDSDGSETLLQRQFNFPGLITACREVTRPAPGSPADTLLIRRKYDHVGRLLRTVSLLNDGTQAVVNYLYDDLGRLRNTSFGEGADTLRLHDRYNLRGWLTRRESRLFSLSLAYEAPSLPSSVPSFAGNISEWSWRHGPESPRNTYAFGYDALSRLTETRQFIDGTPDDRFVERGMTYDRNGNLLSLQRTSDGSERNDFSYTYDGNRLTALTDGPQTYSYASDSDGNRTRDGLHGLEITYNRLNLIEKITRDGTTLANYSYLSDGTKLAATDAAGDGLRYIGSLVYRKHNGNLSLESAAVEGGRIVAAQTAHGTAFLPRYHIADHLGSVRAVVGPDGEVLQQSDYYPFGLRHENPDLAASDNRYGYNGKERQEFLASPYIDYGARQYDPVAVTWNGPDSLSHNFVAVSPYAFCNGNPVKFIDTDGKRVFFAPGTSQAFKDKFAQTVKYMNERGTSGDLAALEASEKIYYIGEYNKEGRTNKFESKIQTIYWDPNTAYRTRYLFWLSPATILGHEMGHAIQYDRNPEQFIKDANTPDPQYWNAEERRNITTTEQRIAKRHKEIVKQEKTRIDHKVIQKRDVSNMTPYQIENENEKFNIHFREFTLDN